MVMKVKFYIIVKINEIINFVKFALINYYIYIFHWYDQTFQKLLSFEIIYLFLFQSQQLLEELEAYISKNPNLIVIDPLPNVKKLLDRYSCYTTIHSTDLHTYDIFTPNFCTLRSNDLDNLREDLRIANVNYPFICKPILGQAHEMSIIFNEKCLMDVRTPCVAQNFIKHDAALYKIFIIGDRHCCVERPSLKNFEACDSETIYFDSGDVSRANARSRLTVLDPDDVVTETKRPDDSIIEVIASTLRKAFGVELLGVDVIVEKGTGRFAVIDANAYPGTLSQMIYHKFFSYET